MTLHTKIYNQIYDELRLRYKHDPDEDVIETAKEAALLAMEKQAEFFRHISGEGWLHEKEDVWYKPHDDSYKTELELYEIWEGQRHE